MIALGIESTAHTFGVGIVSDEDKKCNILANEKHSIITEEGGLIPRELADHHYAHAVKVIGSALEKSGVEIKDVDVIAFAQGPGIGPALKTGAVAARVLALKYGKPLVGVNHCVAHIEIGKALTGAKNPITVYVSGANTQIIGYVQGRYRIYGETLDVGVGNLLDSFGRSMGIGFPAGPEIDRLYFEGKELVELPYTVKGMDLVFSGLQTAAEAKIGKVKREDLCYSLMHTAFAMLTEVSERALAHTEKNELLLTGGVAASKALRKMMQSMCDERGAKMFVPPFEVCVDQGVMIAWQGLIEAKTGRKTAIEKSAINQRFRTDEVAVNWI